MLTQLSKSRKHALRLRPAGTERAAGLMVLVVLLIAAVAVSASLVLTVPQVFDAAATVSGATGERYRGASRPEATFHELYSTTATDDAADPPSF